MPITEIPSSPPTESPKRSKLRAIPRDDLSHHELLQLVDALEDDQARARRREGFWIALIVHIILFWLWSYGPTVILHHPRIISPAEALKERQKDFTYLDLPPDALKHIKPKPSDVISDKNRVQQTQHPTLDKKTIEQLEAMKRAGPPTPPPAPASAPQQQAQTEQQPAPQQPQPQQQAQANPKPELQPLQPAPSQQPPLAQSPRQPAQKPTFNTGGSIRDQLNEAIRSARSSQGAGGEEGAGAPLEHPGAAGNAEILSDTMGVDFGPYLQRVIHATKMSWYNLIPESARPPLNKQGRVMIEFIIQPDGTVKQMRLVGPSGDVALDRAAWGGIQGASPYPQLPKDFKGPYLALRFSFHYNERPDAH